MDIKKLFIALIVLAFSININSNKAYAQHPSDVRFTMGTYSFGSNIYPTIALWNANNPWSNDIFFYFNLVPPKDGSIIRIKIEESPLNYETIIQEIAPRANHWFPIDPLIKWKLDKFPEITQAINFTMTAILEIDGKEIDRINKSVQCRPINEIVYGYYNSKNEWIDTRSLYASFVNENYEAIDPILKEILAVDPNRQFVGYLKTEQDVYNQIFWIWEYFAKQGTRYSNIGKTSNEAKGIGVQHVRFIDQVLNNTQANCVDGSAMLASFFRKIGLDAHLAFIPAHCMVAVSIPKPDGSKTLMYIETTMMGYNTDPYTSYNAATQSAYNTIINTPASDLKVVDISEARAMGIMPIARYLSK